MDKRHFDAVHPDLTFHFDVDPDSDPDPGPIPSFTYVRKSEMFLGLLFTAVPVYFAFSFSSAS